MSITMTSLSSPSADNGNQRPKLPVGASSGTTTANGNLTMSVANGALPAAQRELLISNDNSTSMSITVTCDGGTLAFLLLSGEIIDERLPLFTQVVVTATGNWRWYTRGNLP